MFISFFKSSRGRIYQIRCLRITLLARKSSELGMKCERNAPIRSQYSKLNTRTTHAWAHRQNYQSAFVSPKHDMWMVCADHILLTFIRNYQNTCVRPKEIVGVTRMLYATVIHHILFSGAHSWSYKFQWSRKAYANFFKRVCWPREQGKSCTSWPGIPYCSVLKISSVTTRRLHKLKIKVCLK